MTSKSLRRIAADHASLHTSGLPPNYLFHPSADSDSLSSLSVLLAGPDGTPFSAGIFHLELNIPASYPTAPPTAHFRTKIFHPNVDPATGAVCVDTLKRDWKPDLTLRDILVTVYCLLACPNAASALNAEAGMLIEEDYGAFEKRAVLWTTMYAAVPANLKERVDEAKTRGEAQPKDAAVEAKKLPKKRNRYKTDDLFQLNSETAENSRQGKINLPTNKPSSSLKPDADQVQESSAVRGLGLHLQPDKEPDDMEIEAVSAPDRPPPGVSRPRTRYKLSAPPVAKAPLQSSPFRRRLPAQASPSEHSSAAVYVPGGQRPESKRLRLTPPHQLSSASRAIGTRSTALRKEEYPWLEWHRKIESTPESRSAREAREKFERKRMQAAGGSMDKYNSGAFGPRVGIMRL